MLYYITKYFIVFVNTLILSSIQFQGIAQSDRPYTLVGSARTNLSDKCIKITSAGNGQVGAVWFNERQKISKSFNVNLSLNFGNNSDGADGVVIAFQTSGLQSLGGAAGGIGYKGLSPSLGIEFDTNQNFESGDPAYDHIALLKNGQIDHRLNTDFASPVSLLPNGKTIKDGRDHFVTVAWNAKTSTIRVEVDCVLLIDQSVDLVNTVFSGSTDVIWGFTSATGARASTHTVCLENNTIRSDTVQACYNEQITLAAPATGAATDYAWSPSTGLDDASVRTPKLRVGSPQLYVVRYTDRCNRPKSDSLFVKPKGFLFSLGSDRKRCDNDSVTLVSTPTSIGESVAHRWSTRQSSSSVQVKTSGLYSLTIIADGCVTSDSVKVTFSPLPVLPLPANPVYDCTDSSLMLDPQATGIGLRYSWSPIPSTESVLLAKISGNYKVDITTVDGCSATQRFTIRDNCPSAVFFVPDVFTPNGDGVNDVLKWFGERNTAARMRLFNQWGEVIFASTSLVSYWDGTYQGKECPSGIYTWQLDNLASNQSSSSPSVIMQGKVLLSR